MNVQKHIVILGVVGVLIGGALLGYWTGFSQGTKQAFPPPLSFPEPTEIFAFSGKITELKENAITMEARISSNAAGIVLEPREFLVAQTTKIQEGRLKTAEEFARELQEYQKTAAETGSKTPQSPVTILRDLTFRDLKIGDEILVESNENIKSKTRFEAEKVVRLQL